MDQSQQPASPLQSVSPAELLRLLRHKEKELGEGEAALSPEAIANRRSAAVELTAIYELLENRDFQWFVATFIDGPYLTVKKAVLHPHTPEEERGKALNQYHALRELKAAILEREIAHRELLESNDQYVSILRERLDLL